MTSTAGFTKGPWTRFMDMHSGGRTKQEPYDYILIEAPEAEARAIFWNRFHHNPERVTCTCCGEDYAVSEEPTLEQITAFDRNCEYVDGEYVEKQKQQSIRIRAECKTPDSDRWGLYQTVEEYLKRPDVLVIRAADIKPEERAADIPTQGYVWKD